MSVEFRQLADLQGLNDLLVRLHRGMDRNDEELIRSGFPENEPLRYGGFRGTSDEFAKNVVAMHTTGFAPSGLILRLTQHALFNVRFEVNGDGAFGECYATFRGLTTDGRFETIIVRYIDRYIRTSAGWRIAERDPILEWASHALKPQMSRASARSRRDREDISYHYRAELGVIVDGTRAAE